MKSGSLIRKKYFLNNLQILSKFELQNKLESAIQIIKPNEILSDLNFFKDISQYFDSSNSEKAFLAYKFTLYCYILINNKEQKFFQKLFLKYTKIFIKTYHKYNSFIIIKIYINNIFNERNKKISMNELNKIINILIETYKNDSYNSILDINMNNFIKNESNIHFFFLLLDSFQFAFDKGQIKAIAKFIVINSNLIIKNIIKDKASKISYFKKLNNIIQTHIKDIPVIIINNNSKKKCSIYMSEFFQSILIIYNEIIKLFEIGLYSFYENEFIVGYITKNLTVTIIQFLENKYFSIDENIISKINDLSDNIEKFLLNNLKRNKKKFFIGYSWIMAQFFNFLYHCEDKTQSIEYGNKIINLYKQKQIISRAVIFVKITLYEYYLKIQKENHIDYNINEHLNNLTELLTMFDKCEIEEKEAEKYLTKMINYLFNLLLEHIIYIINKSYTQVNDIYNLLIKINPLMLNCRDNSKNKKLITSVNIFNIFCSLTTIINVDNKEKNIQESKEKNILDFINNNNLSVDEKTVFINIISVFTVYHKNEHEKIIILLNNLKKEDDNIYFLEAYFNIIYQLEKKENYKDNLLFDLLFLLNDFLEVKLKEKNKNDIYFKRNFFLLYIAYFGCGIKRAYREILKINKGKNKNNNNIEPNGINIEISNSIKLLIKFIQVHNQIFEKLYQLIDINNYKEKFIYYFGLILLNEFFLELTNYPNSYINNQIYLISTNDNIFSSLPIYIQNFIYYILYRLIYNMNSIINNRDLFLIKGNNNINKTIKTFIYNNVLIIKGERQNNNITDNFFNLEPLLSFSTQNINIENNNINDIKMICSYLVNKLIFNSQENSLNNYVNFKINFILDTNNLIEIIKLHYLLGVSFDNTYMQNYFNYYIPILNNEKEFNNNFKLILNIFYIFKRIFLIPKIENQNEKIDFTFICNLIKNTNQNNKKDCNLIKYSIIRLLNKYIYITKGKSDNKKKINDLLICLLSEYKELKQDLNLIESEHKTKRYLIYIELLSLEFFIKIFNGKLSDNNIDILLYKGKILLLKCIEILNGLLNEKYINQYLPNEKHRLKYINDFLFEKIDEIDMIYLLNLDDYEFVFLQLLDKIYILTDFLFKKMLAYGYGDSIIEIFHKLRYFTILKYNKHYYQKFISYLIKAVRKWKRKEQYDITVDIYDIKSDNEYDIFISKLYYNYINEKYPTYLNNNKNYNYSNFNIIEFINISKVTDDPLLNKCLELNNIKETFNDKEKSIFFKNKIKSLKNKELNNLDELKTIFLSEFNINNSSNNYYFVNLFIIDYKYSIKIIPRLFEREIINNIILDDKIEIIINSFKEAYKLYKIDNWREYKYIKYYKKNLKNLIYISSSTQKNNISIKLINLYISYFHNFKYNLSYKGNKESESIVENEKEEENIDYTEILDNINNDDKDINMENNNEKEKNIGKNIIDNNSIINIIDNKFNSINLISIFKIRNYFYIYIKIKENSFYDKIDIQKEKEFKFFFINMKKISVKENPQIKTSKKDKNEEYRKALFTLQNLLIKLCPNFIKGLQLYFNFHTNFKNYINSKINKYSLKIKNNEIINWLFEPNNDKIKNNNKLHCNNKRFKLMSIDDYKNKFINKIFNSKKFKFNFYENDINDLFYFIPSIELSKIPLENIPLLYNLAVIRTLNINYIKLTPKQKNISITKDIFCLLNPKSDLKDTEKIILPLIQKYNIQCINSKEPNEKEMKKIINNKLMYIYCGHGDSLKYLKKEYIESHKINFLTFLFGCKSAHSRLLLEKDTQPLSTPQIFLKNLCPFFLGFLWAVTSSDLDKLTVELLEALFKSKNPISLVKLIILLKRKFSLKWYNGGALVMYCNNDILPKFDI